MQGRRKYASKLHDSYVYEYEISNIFLNNARICEGGIKNTMKVDNFDYII